MSEQQVLARMFFKNGNTETRPLSWITFTTSTEFTTPEKLAMFRDRTKSLEHETDEMYVVFTDQLNGIQLFKGVFVNARCERKANHYQR